MIIKKHDITFPQLFWLSLGILLIIFFAFCDLKYGPIDVTFKDILNAFFNPHRQDVTTITILQVRLPIVIMAILSGAALAVSGLLLQRLTKNPLACPSLTGIEYGAAFSITFCYMFIPHINKSLIILIAVFGSFITYLLMQWVIKKVGVTAIGITLVGVAFNTLYYSAIQIILLMFPYQAQSILYDLNGTFQGIQFADLKIIWLPIITLLAFSLFFCKRLDLLELDEMQARSLGFRVHKFRLWMLVIAILLATIVTTITGPLLFFGLIIPHLVKPLGRNTILMIAAVIYGSAFLLFAEFITRIVTPETPPPVGLIMLLLGMPLLILIIRKYFVYEN